MELKHSPVGEIRVFAYEYGMIALYRNVSEQTEAFELRERLAAIVDASDDAIVSTDLAGMIRTWNRGAERLFGYSAYEIIGKSICTLSALGGGDQGLEMMNRIAAGGRVDHCESKLGTKARETVIVSLTAAPIHDSGGAIIGGSMVVRDITEQKRIYELQERLSAIVQSADDAILSKDLEGIIQTWNRGAERLFGYAAHEVIGKHISTLAAPESADEIPEILTRVAHGERVDHFETKRKAKDGRIFAVSLTVSPVRDSSGKIIGASKVVRDITEREVKDQVLREANSALVRSNDDLEHFANSASHDLQEPLRTVKIYSQMLEREFSGKLGPAGDQYIAYAIGAASRMEQLLKDLRTYMMASTAAPKAKEQVNAGEALDRVLQTLELALKKSGAFITRTSLPQVGIPLFHLEQVFQNLIVNAITYCSTDRPRIHIAAHRRGDWWEFSVQDNGIGIDSRYHAQIFERFKRLQSSEGHAGSGMGLAICKRIVERAGGRMWVESEAGLGSTFRFTLPCTEPVPQTLEAALG